MFRHLRFRLTALYLLVGIALIVLVGGSAYGLLRYYFQSSTDLAIHHKLVLTYQQLGIPVPADLAATDAAWYNGRNQPFPSTALGAPTATPHSGESDDNGGHPEKIEPQETYNAELAAVFVLPLDANGAVVTGLTPALPPITPDRQAVQAALARGSDWRVVRIGDENVRLLTYRVNGPNGLAVLQLGRTLADQDRLLNQLLLGLLAFGGASVVLLGAGSWWLAGRSLVPAQQSWERQRAFVANASHELRTPLTLLRASTEVARRHLPPGDTDGRALLDDVLGECDHMSRLVGDLLLLSKLDASALSLERSLVDLPALLADVQRQVGRLAEERGIRLTVDGCGAAWGDATRLRQVLLILLDNALRHTPAGGTIDVTARPQGRQVRLVVADTGRGIAPDDLPHLFERFYRASGAASGEGSGSGLGLAIAKALIDTHHGQIRVESQLGQGTRVVITLPAARGRGE